MKLTIPSLPSPQPALMALLLRLGLGAVFVIGGWNKLQQLLHPDKVDGILASYMGAKGYINPFFADYLFNSPGALLTPWSFLTALSTFELFSGIALIIGLLVRPLALIYAFLLWTFVMALPVVTAAGVEPGAVVTHTGPALLVQIRDIGLSGLMFVLYALGSGRYSLDRRLFGVTADERRIDWQAYGLLTRLSVAFPLLVGGFFAGMPNIQSFATAPLLLAALGLALAFAVGTRVAGALAAGVMAYYMLGKIDLDHSLIANLNSFKRELAFFAAGAVLAYFGGGARYGLRDFAGRFSAWRGAFRQTRREKRQSTTREQAAAIPNSPASNSNRP